MYSEKKRKNRFFFCSIKVGSMDGDQNSKRL